MKTTQLLRDGLSAVTYALHDDLRAEAREHLGVTDATSTADGQAHRRLREFLGRASASLHTRNPDAAARLYAARREAERVEGIDTWSAVEGRMAPAVAVVG